MSKAKGMKLKLPKSVKVLGKKYKVVVAEPEVKVNGADKLLDSSNFLYGRCNSRDCTITLNADQDVEQMKDTLVHEMLHAYDYSLQLDLTEHQVRRLAVCVMSMLADNPEVAKLLTK